MQRLEAGAAQIIMEEKRAHKVRKSGGGRKKLKPEYDAGKNLKEQMEVLWHFIMLCPSKP